MARSYKPEHRGRLTDLLWPTTSQILINLLLPVMILLFWVLNRTRVIGRENVRRARNTLLLSNHQSMIDSFVVGIAAFYPHHFLKPYLVPWNPAAQENFFKNRFFRWFFDQLRCIPVKQGRRDLRAIYNSMRVLRDGTMILFPEGTRSRDGSIGRARPGAGLVILGNRPQVVPVAIDGLADVLPIGAAFPRFGKRVWIYFGEPIDYTDLLDGPRSRETAQAVVDRVMASVRRQREAIRRLRAISRLRR